MEQADIKQLVEEFYSLCNESTPEKVKSIFRDDAEMKCTGIDVLSGKAIGEYITSILEACPGMRFSVREFTELKATGGATEEALVLWRGEIPDGISAREGMIIVDGIDRIQVKDGAISRVESYFDRVQLAADLFLSSPSKAIMANI